MPEATIRDVPYGPHERNVMDFWAAPGRGPRPVYLFIHGGGFRKGDKSNAPPVLLEECLRAGISFAAANYRLSGTHPYPAAFHDGARALQFLRSKAAEWRLDPGRVGMGGGSAGSGVTLWIAVRPDMARPDSADPVERQSTRIQCIANWNAQSSYCPDFLRHHIPGPAWRETALQELFRLTLEEYETPRAKTLLREVHMLADVTADVPPIFLWYSHRNTPDDAEITPEHSIHHPKFGFLLKEKMDRLGIPCTVRAREDFQDCGDEEAGRRAFLEMARFLIDRLKP